jgi:hypothetical protein
MEAKGIIATTRLDRHGDKIEKEALETVVDMINAGTEAIGVTIEHDGLTMPIGKVIRGKLVQLDDGEFAVATSQEIFDIHSISTPKLSETYYVAESSSDHRPFADLRIEDINKLTVSFDPHNFECNDFIEMKNFLHEEHVEVELEVRKSVLPDPEIIFHLVTGTLIVWSGKKTIEKLSNDVSTDISNCYGIIKKAIVKFAQYCIPKNRPKTYRLREQGEYIKELAIRTTNPDIVIEALQPDKLKEVETVIEKSLGQFNIFPAKVQLIYESDNKMWKLNYLLTTSGQAIGTEQCYKRTIDLFNRVSRADGSAAASISGVTASAIENE